MRRQVSFLLEAKQEDAGHTRWSISFTKEGEELIIGLHWNEKAIPTHVFKMSSTDFNKMVAEFSGAPK